MEATNETGKNHAGAQSRAGEAGANLSGGLDMRMNKQRAKIDRLIKSMDLFFKHRTAEKCCWLNGELPPKQRKQLKSILKQAEYIDCDDV